MLTGRAHIYGIRPPGPSFLHLELGTTHLLHAVDRYLSSGSSVACLVPGTVLNRHHHELFRQRKFLHAVRPVALEINEVWQIEHGTFKYPGAAIIGHKRTKPNGLAKTAIGGFLAKRERLEATDFLIHTIGDKRTAWVLEKDGLPVSASAAVDIPPQGADLMPRTAVCIEISMRLAPSSGLIYPSLAPHGRSRLRRRRGAEGGALFRPRSPSIYLSHGAVGEPTSLRSRRALCACRDSRPERR